MNYFIPKIALFSICIWGVLINSSEAQNRGVRTVGTIVMNDGRKIEFDKIGTYSDLSGDYIEFSEEPISGDFIETPLARVKFRYLSSVSMEELEEKEKKWYFSGNTTDKLQVIKCTYRKASVILIDGTQLSLLTKINGEWPCKGTNDGFHVSSSGLRRKIDFVNIKNISFENTNSGFEEMGLSVQGMLTYRNGKAVKFDHVSEFHDFSGDDIEFLEGNIEGNYLIPTEAEVSIPDVAGVEFGKRITFSRTVDGTTHECRWREAKVTLKGGNIVDLFIWAPPYDDQNFSVCGSYPSHQLSFLSKGVQRRNLDLNLLQSIKFGK